MTSPSENFKKLSEMSSDGEFIEYLEDLVSGSAPTTRTAGTGINAVLGRLARNTDALLDAVQSLNNGILTFTSGAGTLAWDSGTGILSWSTNLSIILTAEVGTAKSNVIASGNATLSASGKVAYAVLDRTTDGATVAVTVVASLAAYVSAIAAANNKLDFYLLAYRSGTDIILWDGRRLRTGYSLTNNGSTDSQYGQQTDLTALTDDVQENLKLFVTGGGTLNWNLGTTTLTWSATITVVFPEVAGTNTLAATSKVIAAGEVAYITLSRAPGAPVVKTVSVVAQGDAALNGDDILVLAYHNATDSRLYLWSGMSLSDGDSVLLGGVRSGNQWWFNNSGTLYNFTNATAVPVAVSFGTGNNFRVGTHELMVFRNGVKAKIGVDYTETGTSSGNAISWILNAGGGADSYIEAFVALHGDGPSPVESVGIYSTGVTLFDGDVKLKAGTNISLTEDIPNNAIVVGVTAGAGVADVNGVTGSIDFTSPNATIVITPSGQDIELDLNVTTDVFDGLAATYGVSAAHPMVSTAYLNPFQGFTEMHAEGDSTIDISGGVFIRGGFVASSTSKITLDVTSDIYPGDILSGNWNYLYFLATANGAAPTVVVSSSPPAGSLPNYHPDDINYVYYGPVYLNGAATEVRACSRTGNTLTLSNGPSILGVLTAGIPSVYSTATEIDLSDYLPESGIVSVNLRLIVKLVATGVPDTSAHVIQMYTRPSTLAAEATIYGQSGFTTGGDHLLVFNWTQQLANDEKKFRLRLQTLGTSSTLSTWYEFTLLGLVEKRPVVYEV